MNINENLEIFNMLKEAEVIKRENFDLNNKLDSYLNEIVLIYSLYIYVNIIYIPIECTEIKY